MAQAPRTDMDLYSTAALLDPYPLYGQLRDAAPAVWLDAHGMYVIARYADVRAALGNPEVFSSAKGVMMNDTMNSILEGILLCTDRPRHDVLRKVIERPLLPKQLAELRERVTQEAEALVERLVAKQTFDAATELSQYLPVTIVSELVGLPEEGRERMLVWAAANFDCFGPLNERTQAALPVVGEMVEYAMKQCVPGKLKPGGWAQQIWDAADRGEIEHAICPRLMNDYMGPSLDTTIFATTNAISLFAQHPGEWERVRANPALIPQAINEVVRIEAPLQGFSRLLTRDHEVEGIDLPAGSRAIVLYGSANRDERKWGDPDNFRIEREGSTDHLGFGFGEHRCVGNNLARMEMRALLGALARRVERFEVLEMERGVNNVLRGIKKLVVKVH